MKQLSFSVDGQQIVGTIHYPQKLRETNPALLFIHGWMSSQKSNILYAKELTKLGYICMTFDLRSHGESEGERKVLSRVDYLNDCITAYDFLAATKGVAKDKIGVVGSSFGSYLALLLSVQRTVRWLSLRVPANYPDEGFSIPQVKISGSKTTAWRNERLAPDATKSLRALHAFAHEVLLVESELDELVPTQTIENYKNAMRDQQKLSHIIMQNTDHSMKRSTERIEYTTILSDWFAQQRF